MEILCWTGVWIRQQLCCMGGRTIRWPSRGIYESLPSIPSKYKKRKMCLNLWIIFWLYFLTSIYKTQPFRYDIKIHTPWTRYEYTSSKISTWYLKKWLTYSLSMKQIYFSKKCVPTRKWSIMEMSVLKIFFWVGIVALESQWSLNFLWGH